MPSKSAAPLPAPVANVRDEGARTWIEGVQPGTTGDTWDAILRGLEIILRFRGESANLDELMAWSGDAFNLCHGSNWQGVSYLCIPTNPVANIAQTVGFEYTCVHSGYGRERMDGLPPPKREVETRGILERIWREIDAGRPALVGGVGVHCGDWIVTVGYDPDKLMLCHIGPGEPYEWMVTRGFPGNPVYDDDKERDVDGRWNGRFRGSVRPDFVGGWQDNPAYLIGERTPAPTREESVVAALRRAVELFRAPSHHIGWWGGVDYHFGERAYEEWAKALHELDYPGDLDRPLPEDAYDWYEMGNMDTQVDQIVRGREAAAMFCKQAKGVLGEAEGHLMMAAKHYWQEVSIAKGSFATFIPAYAGDDVKRVAWLSEEPSREKGVDAIRRMLDEERAAVAAIEEALASAR